MIIEDLLVREPVRALDTLNLPLPRVLLGAGALDVSLLVSPELEWKWKHFPAGRAAVLGYVCSHLAVLTGQMVLQVVLLDKLLPADITLEMSLSVVSEKVLL